MKVVLLGVDIGFQGKSKRLAIAGNNLLPASTNVAALDDNDLRKTQTSQNILLGKIGKII